MTNLNTGPYSSTGIAKAYKQALNISPSQYYLEDFAPYFPSYEAAASFIATPIVVRRAVNRCAYFSNAG